MLKKPGIPAPFQAALDGVVFTFRTQKHMRIHMFAVVAVLLMGVVLHLGMRELLTLLFTISLVIIAEMFNSAIEATVDLVSPNYNPLAKFAKDIAAGAVLITTIFALVVGGLLLIGESRWEAIKINFTGEGLGLPFVPRVIVAGLTTFFIVVIGKGLGKRGRVLQGGLVSGHAAFAFLVAVSTIFLTDSPIVVGIAIILAGMVAQSRYEARFHSVLELTLGAFFGSLVAIVFFYLVPR